MTKSTLKALMLVGATILSSLGAVGTAAADGEKVCSNSPLAGQRDILETL
jgi:hypothetical protein